MADVVGYSRLTHVDEPGTLSEFKRHLKEYIQPAIRHSNGKLIKTLGDGLLATFDSPVNAVRCALEMQAGAGRCNGAIPASRQLRFRIGINLGDVVFEKNDVFGDAVNVASRLETLARPSTIIASDSVAQYIKGKLRVTLDDLGEQRVKNIPEPVRAWQVNPAEGIGEDRPSPVRARLPAVAVLPFQNISGDPDQHYFSDGVTEDIITELARFKTLSVIARTSSFVYRDKAVDIKQVAEELNAQFVVEGSVRKLGNRVRVTVQLVEADSGLHVWAEKYDVPLEKLFEIQDDVTRRVVATLLPRIEAEELARRRPTVRMRAYDHYLRGKALFYAARDAAARAEARRYFERAIAIDPDFARAYCYLSAIDNNRLQYEAAGTAIALLRDRAREYALKAVALDPNDPLAHFSVAWTYLWRREFELARKHFDVATSLNPNDADFAMDRGTTLMFLGEPENAIRIMSEGMRLNPYHPDSYRADFAEACFVAHRYDEMITLAEQLEDRSPRFTAWKAAAYAYVDRLRDARRNADAFLSSVRAIWEGAPEADEADFVDWMLSFCPFRRQSDTDHLVEGLRRAGLRVRQRARKARPSKPVFSKQPVVAILARDRSKRSGGHRNGQKESQGPQE
jgi:TolB-like protein/Tfp pilus assembly protein PilF